MKKGLCIIGVCVCANLMAAPLAKLTIESVDEEGKPVVNAVVDMTFEPFDGKQPTTVNGSTDKNGLFAGEGETHPNVGVSVEKDGYYKSYGSHLFAALKDDKTRYEPWGYTNTVVLRKIIDPQKGKLASTHRGTSWIAIPEFDNAVGFDVLESDWVAPYGTGKVADFVFTFSKDTEQQILSYELTFSNQGDGIVEYQFDKNCQSIFRWPYNAPLDGYVSDMERMTGYNRSKAIIPPGQKMRKQIEINYIFRVRTVFDDEGKIKSALYGKITGEIGLATKPKDQLRFGYWLNTDPHSRSLESSDPMFP